MCKTFRDFLDANLLSDIGGPQLEAPIDDAAIGLKLPGRLVMPGHNYQGMDDRNDNDGLLTMPTCGQPAKHGILHADHGTAPAGHCIPPPTNGIPLPPPSPNASTMLPPPTAWSAVNEKKKNWWQVGWVLMDRAEYGSDVGTSPPDKEESGRSLQTPTE